MTKFIGSFTGGRCHADTLSKPRSVVSCVKHVHAGHQITGPLELSLLVAHPLACRVTSKRDWPSSTMSVGASTLVTFKLVVAQRSWFMQNGPCDLLAWVPPMQVRADASLAASDRPQSLATNRLCRCPTGKAPCVRLELWTDWTGRAADGALTRLPPVTPARRLGQRG